MKRIFFITAAFLIGFYAFANGGENPLLGMWELIPQFILSEGDCRIPMEGGAIWNFVNEKTVVVASNQGGEEIEIGYRLDTEKSIFTIGAGNDSMDIHYSLLDENTIILVVYLADNKQYNVAVFIRTGK